MKIAYIVSPSNYYSNIFSGVVVQARCWREALLGLGHQVELLDAMEQISWSHFEILHLFQHGPWCETLIEDLRKTATKVVLSPIIDPPKPYGLLARAMSAVPFERLRLQQNQRLLRQYGRKCSGFLSRSSLEARSLEAVGVPADKIKNVPISMSKSWNVDEHELGRERNGAVFHVSHLSQPRKNVRRLVEASIKFDFSLRLAGSVQDPAFADWLSSICSGYPNIEYLGQIDDDQMRAEMLACSVFCLPSLFEGVGLVALDAAYCGANLVVTTAGGTRDYLDHHAEFIDPLDINALGAAIKKALKAATPNVGAHRHVRDNFSKLSSGKALAAAYSELLANR